MKDQAFILATLKQTLILFQLLMNSQEWNQHTRDECCRLIRAVSCLKADLASIVGTEEADRLVKDAYEYEFSRARS